jgi:hypothetical protein
VKFIYLFLFIVSFSSISQSYTEEKDGIHINDKSFPWELVIDRGKILGCVYDNRFYSLGAILILESLPRKCILATDRNGIWEQLPESELVLFKENIATQQKLERESTYIGSKPINIEEARLIRYLRRVKEFADKSKK